MANLTSLCAKRKTSLQSNFTFSKEKTSQKGEKMEKEYYTLEEIQNVIAENCDLHDSEFISIELRKNNPTWNVYVGFNNYVYDFKFTNVYYYNIDYETPWIFEVIAEKDENGYSVIFDGICVEIKAEKLELSVHYSGPYFNPERFYNALVIYDYEKKHILMQNSKKEPDKLDILYGKNIKKESEIANAQRLLFEKLGIKKNEIELVHKHDFKNIEKKINIHVMCAILKDDATFKASEDYRWVDKNENFFDSEKFASDGYLPYLIKFSE